MGLSWTEGSIADLEHIRRYVTAFQPGAARRLAWRIVAIAQALDAQGSDGPESEEIVEHPIAYPFLLRYRRSGGDAVVLAVRHSHEARIV